MPSPPDDPRVSPLIAAAREAAARAYAPYSHFHVGACLMADDDTLFAGCNVENASYGLTVCAERNAVFQMVAAGKQRFHMIVIYTPTPEPTPPCGACRQVLREFANDAVVVSLCDGPAVLRTTVAELLPHGFELKGTATRP
jgi:cytidine deaminase